MNSRIAEVKRSTRETEIELVLNVDGTRQVKVETGIGFLDHMISSLAFHAGWDIELRCSGDLQVDDHHTVEDCGLVLGEALDSVVGDKVGILRFGSKYAPLDEALARSVIDFSGRAHSCINLDLKREMLGAVACENLSHFFQSLASRGNFTLHVDVLKGENDHHKAEAAFKATALALRESLTMSTEISIPSTKGLL